MNACLSVYRFLRGLFVAAALAGVFGLAHAQNIDASGGALVPITNGFQAVYNGRYSGLGMARNYTATQVGGVAVADTIEVAAGPAGRALSVVATRTATAAAIGSGVAAVVGAGMAGYAVGTWAYDLLSPYRIGPAPGGGLLQDQGQALITKPGYEVYVAANGWFVGSPPYGTCGNDVQCAVSTYMTVADKENICGSVSNFVGFDHLEDRTAKFKCQRYITDAKVCPAYHDFWRNVDVPEGSAPGYDGKCSGGAYTSVSNATTGDLVRDALSSTDGVARGLAASTAKSVIDAGGSIVPDSASPTVSGPASQTGTAVTSTSTTTNSSGQQETTQTTRTPVLNYSYQGDKVTYTITNNTTNQTTNNVTNQTTTTTSSQTSDGSAEDLCVKYPTRAGCVGIGEPPNDRPPENGQYDVGSIPEVGFSGPAGCPSPITFSVLGRSYSLDYSPICAACTSILYPLVITVASWGALLAFFRSFKV